jgi:hypothetical protein
MSERRTKSKTRPKKAAATEIKYMYKFFLEFKEDKKTRAIYFIGMCGFLLFLATQLEATRRKQKKNLLRE